MTYNGKFRRKGYDEEKEEKDMTKNANSDPIFGLLHTSKMDL